MEGIQERTGGWEVEVHFPRTLGVKQEHSLVAEAASDS